MPRFVDRADDVALAQNTNTKQTQKHSDTFSTWSCASTKSAKSELHSDGPNECDRFDAVIFRVLIVFSMCARAEERT